MITSINNLEDVAKFTSDLIAEGSTVHPDDDFHEFVNMSTGEPTYTQEQAEIRNALMGKAVKVCDENLVDVYDFMQDIFLKETGLDKYIPGNDSIISESE